MRFGFDAGDFSPGDFVIYSNGGDSHDGPVEVGVVKRVCADGCFVAYNLGDTVAKTPFDCLIPVLNDYAMKGLVDRSEQLGRKFDGLTEGCEVW